MRWAVQPCDFFFCSAIGRFCPDGCCPCGIRNVLQGFVAKSRVIGRYYPFFIFFVFYFV